MDRAAFSNSPVGQLLPIRGFDSRHSREYQHVAFFPEPLPETVHLESQTWITVAEAMNALGRLDQATKQVPNPSLLRRPAIRKEAVSTSALEGTHAAFPEVLEAEADIDESRHSPELVEVLNYVRAAEHAFALIRDRGLTVNLLNELQEILVRNTPAEEKDPGRIRSHQVVIGPDGSLVEEARFVPPPPGDILEGGFREWERWVATPRSMPSVVQTALAHYQFETLHPYHDGNGRISRLAIVLQLMLLGELDEPLLTLSTWLEVRRQQYQDSLLEVSQTGNFDQWVRFFCAAVKEQSERTVDKMSQLLDLQEEFRRQVRENRIKGVAAQIAEDLVGQPITTPTFASKVYGVSYPAANTAITRLEKMGILQELTGRKYDRVFGSKRVIRIMEDA